MNGRRCFGFIVDIDDIEKSLYPSTFQGLSLFGGIMTIACEPMEAKASSQ